MLLYDLFPLPDEILHAGNAVSGSMVVQDAALSNPCLARVCYMIFLSAVGGPAYRMAYHCPCD